MAVSIDLGKLIQEQILSKTKKTEELVQESQTVIQENQNFQEGQNIQESQETFGSYAIGPIAAALAVKSFKLHLEQKN